MGYLSLYELAENRIEDLTENTREISEGLENHVFLSSCNSSRALSKTSFSMLEVCDVLVGVSKFVG